MADPNCHFVSRFLTTPWEFADRQLHFYDFETRLFDSKSSRNLFAVKGANTEATEKRLNQIVETPISGAIARSCLQEHPSEPVSIDWPLFRALALLMPIQVARIARQLPATLGLAAICSWPDAKLDELASAVEAEMKFVSISVSARSPLFYPSQGYFILPFPLSTTPGPGAIAFPLTEKHAIAMLPKEIDDANITELLSLHRGELVSALSVGTNPRQVVIHPRVMNSTKPDVLREYLEATRAKNLSLIQAAADLNRSIVEAPVRFGVSALEALRVAQLGHEDE